MPKSKTPLSNASSYAAVGEYWDSHDLADHWGETHEVEFEVDLGPSVIYFAVADEPVSK